ncbi:MAG TPA: hypothetical protein VGO68_04945 [Pyrinomonadaceae bacterium]|jgi:hypothetical protein|nr:hypothetical protein [Pyrinomonadaceae bacterium]
MSSFGVRRQSEAETALWVGMIVIQGGVALRLPAHSKEPPHSKERSSHEYLC